MPEPAPKPDESHAIAPPAKPYRCIKCRRVLFGAELVRKLSTRCKRCGHLNSFHDQGGK